MQLSLFPENHQPDWEQLRRCLRADVVAIDVETDTRYPGYGPHMDYGLSYPADVTVIALAWREGVEGCSTAIAAPFDDRVRTFLVDLFTTIPRMVAHNAVFDMRQLSKYSNGILPKHIWDTYSMARLLSPKVDARYGLLGVAESLGLTIPERQRALKSQRGKLHTVPLEVAMEYAQDDARLSLAIYERQLQLPQDNALVAMECRAVYEYSQMAARGIRLNLPYTERYLEALHKRRADISERLHRDGLNSPRNAKARAQYLYQTKGIPMPTYPDEARFFTRAGRHRLAASPTSAVQFSDLSTNSRVIDSYLSEHSPHRAALQDLSAFQEVDWLISNLESLQEHAYLNGRLHSLVTMATDSGRRASSHPHMQNWKMPDMAGVAIGDEGYTLVEIDYRNAENIMAALISGDSALAAACATPDFHSAMAAEYFGAAWANAAADERKQLRSWSKKITYGTNYGMGARSLGRSLGVSLEEAYRLMRAKDAAFPQVTRHRAAAQREAERTQRLLLWTGRPVAVPTPFVAWNYLCQGGVSEVVKRAIVVLSEAYREQGYRSRVALDMHDALVIEVAHDEWDSALGLASQVMSNATPVELNQRTKPPIEWDAKPDLAENRYKWGAEQWHPQDSGT